MTNHTPEDWEDGLMRYDKGQFSDFGAVKSFIKDLLRQQRERIVEEMVELIQAADSPYTHAWDAKRVILRDIEKKIKKI